MGLIMEKNFQIWHHRRCIVEILGNKCDLASEMEFLDLIFESDQKNYHAWSYRIWLVERFQLWATEKDFIEKLMNIDSSNNSLWSYRYFILHKSPVGTLTPHSCDSE
jgi:protein farnesyltransferase/geranylgeranyltransferase type-1 subunit alpha